MSCFSEMLGRIIKNHQISVYHLAKIIPCDRTRLQKIISGERHMDFETFVALRQELAASVSQNTLDELYERYVRDYYGDQTYRCIHFIKDRMHDIRNAVQYRERGLENKWQVRSDRDNLTVLPKEAAVLEKVSALLQKEWETAIKRHQKIKLFVFFPAGWKELKELFFCFLTQNGIRENVDFRYVVGNGANRRNKQCYEDDPEMGQIENYMTHLEFALYGYNTLIDDNDDCRELPKNILFPYYIITNTGCLLLSVDGELAVEAGRQAELREIEKKFLAVASEKKRFLQKTDYDKLGLALLETDGNQTEKIEIIGRFSAFPFCHEKLLDRIVPLYCSNRQEMIRLWGHFCQMIREQRITMVFTIRSVKQFMESGEAEIFGQQIGFPLTFTMKLALINELWEYFRNTESAHLYLLKEEQLDMGEIFPMFSFNNKCVCSGGVLCENNTRAEAVGLYYSPAVVKNMKKFQEYMIHSQLFLDKERSLRALKKMIGDYECAAPA